MKSVLHLLSSSGFHGAEASVLELCKALIRREISSSVVIFDQGAGVADSIGQRFTNAGIPTMLLKCQGRLDMSVVKRLRGIAASGDTAIIHSHKYKTTPYALIASRGNSICVVATYHNWLYESRALRIYARIDKFLSRYCDACVAVSDAIAGELAKHAGATQVTTIRNGVDADYWTPCEMRNRDQADALLVVGFVGRLSSEKGVGNLLEALALIPEIGDRKLGCLLVGDGDELSVLQKRSEQPDLRGRVEFAGTISDVRHAYARMDLIALPSKNEGFPMVLLEAMSMGVPGVATNVGDVSKLVRNGETGILLSSSEPEILAAAIRELLGSESRRREMGQAARSLVLGSFSTTSTADAYLALYQNLLGDSA